MTLIFDNRAALAAQPGVHLFIVGVSAYAHLPNGSGPPAPNTFGMQQLSSTALTAYRIYQWFLAHQDNLPLPLATCRLLLSPSPSELAVEPALAGLAEAGTRANFVREAKGWQQDANLHRDSITIFYFAGHGVQRTKEDAVLLLADFADPNAGGVLTNSAELHNLFYGMASTASRPNMARTQIYFVDACRVWPKQFTNFERLTVPDIFDVESGGIDDRRAPIFFAALPGAKAYALRNDQTLFSKALTQCLNGAAAEAKEETAGNQPKWIVSVYSLSETLESQIEQMNESGGYEQDFELGGKIKDVPLHILTAPPTVEASISIEPPEALAYTSLEIQNGDGVAVCQVPAPVTPHPYAKPLPAGFYVIRAIIQPPDPRFTNKSHVRPVRPLHPALTIRVAL